MTNIYKMSGIFSCRHPAHKQFDYDVSPYHIFKTGRCWPDGCVEFLWRCHIFDKGHKCPRKFKHVGRACASCKQYYEIKNCYAPVTALDRDGIRDFIRSFNEFESWLENMKDKTCRFSGIVDSIRPHLTMKIGRQGEELRMDGYFISFRGGHLGNELFEDRIYLQVNAGFLDKFGPAPTDELECDTIFAVDRGRVILRNPRRIELIAHGEESYVTISRALVGRATGKIITGSIAYCKECPYTCLIDITDDSRQKTSYYRRFYCLRGVIDPEHCPVRLGILSDENSPNRISRRF